MPDLGDSVGGDGKGWDGEGGGCPRRYMFVFLYIHNASDRRFPLLVHVCSYRVRCRIPMTATAALQVPVSLIL